MSILKQKPIVIYSYCETFGETCEADLMVTVLKKAGLDCCHIGMKKIDEPIKPFDVSYIAIIFFSIELPKWNKHIIQTVSSKATTGLYTGENSSWISLVKEEYESLYVADMFFDIISWAINLSVGRNANYPLKKNFEKGITSLFVDRGDLTRKRLHHAMLPTYYKVKNDRQEEQFYFRQINHIIHEMKLLIDKYQVTGFHIADISWDINGKNRQRVITLLKILAHIQLNAVFSAVVSPWFQNRILIDNNLFHRAGFYRIYLDIKATNEDDCHLFEVPFKLTQTSEAINFWNTQPIDLYCSVHCFHPFSNINGLISSLEFLHKHTMCSFKNFLTYHMPSPDSHLYQMCKNNNLISADEKEYISCANFHDQLVAEIYTELRQEYQYLTDMGYTEGEHEGELLSYVLGLIRNEHNSELFRKLASLRQRLRCVLQKLSSFCAEYFTIVLRECSKDQLIIKNERESFMAFSEQINVIKSEALKIIRREGSLDLIQSL